MSKRINSYQAVASFVRGFFEAYARGIMDAAVGGDDFQKKNDPKEVKQMMLEHYGEVNQYFFDIIFSTLVRLNYKSAEEANERMQKNFESMKKTDPTLSQPCSTICASPANRTSCTRRWKLNTSATSPGSCRVSLQA